MTAHLIDGKSMAERLRNDVATGARRFSEHTGRRPGLAVLLVGTDPASEVYVNSKVRLSHTAGLESQSYRLPGHSSEAEVIALVRQLNKDPLVDGILVQLPLPKHMDAQRVLLSIDPGKDVDGLHPESAGRLLNGMPGLAPCTPLGAMLLIRSVLDDVVGLEAVVIGRSILVGKPLAQMLLAANATVTVAHSLTRDLPSLSRRADILIAAVGRPEMVRGDWIKPGAVVIDVGINRLPNSEPTSKGRLVGDVAFKEAAMVAGSITPVPGGVGPMTIACLLSNTLKAAESRSGLAPSEGD